jgi:hypothetical protein
MITPTVGRVVWFYQDARQAEPFAAIISKVHSDTLVNLMVINQYGSPGGVPDVELCQGDTCPSDRAHCLWMPYQKGQAAKTEALESQLKGVA